MGSYLAGEAVPNLAEFESAEIIPSHENIELTGEEVEWARAATAAAEQSWANPDQSLYFVNTAGRTETGNITTGGNEEKGQSEAPLHGETSTFANVHQQFPDERVTNIGFFNTAQDPAMLGISPCGPCRDYLIKYTDGRDNGGELLMSSGNRNMIVVGRLADYMKESGFLAIDPSEVDIRGVKAASLAINLAESEYLPDGTKELPDESGYQKDLRPEVYGVALVGAGVDNGRVWRGSLTTTSGYDGVPPGYNATAHWRNSIEEGEVRDDLKGITVVRYGALPTNLVYRDRQRLLELDEVLTFVDGRVEPLPVVLANVDPESGQVVEAAVTNTAELLPRPFSARSIGLNDLVRTQAVKLLGKANIVEPAQ